ncbi:MAG TPA: CaiB/BaiF CoA-transferase family protein [Acidimicrobiia bacterium]|nr:CaiB/BaiF CoA-transferase family protein [Acidimicrobiia bacterium]
MTGPLQGMRVVEIASQGPAPFCGMILADLGADVVRVDRPDTVTSGHTSSTRSDFMGRGKSSIGVDLKHEEGVRVVLRLVRGADALIEGLRPGVTERLGIGPAPCLAQNPALVYGRMTGWGQDGPLSGRAGHDIDYIALSGVLAAIGPSERPLPPLNLVGDFGGGGMLLAVGLLAAILHARETGRGQVIDAAMVDGSALLTTALHGHIAEGWWAARREDNLLDGGAPFYAVYGTADDRHLAVGALEPQFFFALLEGLEIDPESLPAQGDRAGWPVIRAALAAKFASESRDHWAEHFASMDACVAPVLDTTEAKEHSHNRARSVFIEVDGLTQPAPAPRFSDTPLPVPTGPAYPGKHTDQVLKAVGYSGTEVSMLRRVGAVA